MVPRYRQKIFNDPIYGFIGIPDELLFRVIEHPFFQRLRRIKQLGGTHLVYPGALHTRFHHALGAMHLMVRAIEVIRSKGHEVTDEESKAACLAILLHDIGHGPYSHSLEFTLADTISHEELSLLFMDRLNKEFDGQLDMAIAIFQGNYQKHFLHQLVTSQLDVDRLDYLKRDSFYTGVSEGVISTDRIISMLNVVNDELAVEVKGIYSIEKFLIARRLMYWQVYLHKTVIASEKLLINILRRASELTQGGEQLFATPALQYFLMHRIDSDQFHGNNEALETFSRLDDYDIMSAIKVWASHNDRVLGTLAGNFVDRHLFAIRLENQAFAPSDLESLRENAKRKLSLTDEEVNYFVFDGEIANNAYTPKQDRINILLRDGRVIDVVDAADQLNVSALSEPVTKHYLCYPK